MLVNRFGLGALLSVTLLFACGDGFTEFPEGTGGSGGSGNSGAGNSGAGADGGAGTSNGGVGGDAGGAVGGAGAQGGAGGGGDDTCTWSPDSNPCGAGYYCATANCGDGVCALVPTNDDQSAVQVCGCDDVQYWNANTAAAHGVPVANTGRCEESVQCVGETGCRADHHCGQLLESVAACVLDSKGTCWGLPDDCQQIGFGGQFRACAGGGAVACLDRCEAIRADGAYWVDQTCPQ